MSFQNREFSPEFRIAAAKRMVAGESVTKLHQELGIKGSVLYRWRDALREHGEAGLQRARGRPPGVPNPEPPPRASEEERLRAKVAQLERKVGQQTIYLDFFKRAFERVKESSQNKGAAGATASTRRSKP
jgi:transposase-like protein